MILRIASWSSLSLNNWQELSPDSEIFRYVSSGVLIALDMMETQDGRESFGRLADQFDRYALGSRNFGNDLLQAGEFVREYFSRLRAEFPVMLVDYDMPANMSANIQRLPWPGDFGSFNPASQVVFLNGSFVLRMVNAGRVADQDPRNAQSFWDFQFLLTTIIAHELAHVMTTWLGQGNVSTPSNIGFPGYDDYASGLGEAGRWLEDIWFQGSIEAFWDSEQEDWQAGMIFLINSGDHRGWRITTRAINEAVCLHRFTFPFEVDVGPIALSTLQEAGRPFSFTPARPAVGNLPTVVQTARTMQGYRVSDSDLRMVPQAPGSHVRFR